MANGLMYPTGVSAAPIDVSSGARAFMQSAIESRLNEIQSSQKEISKNQENVMKAMSVKALPELAKAQRDRYQTEIETYRQGVIDKFKESGGKLTLQQQKEIQDNYVDLQQRMLGEVNELKQFDSFKKIALDPNFQYAYDPDKYEKIMGETYNNLMQGKGLGDLTAKVAGAMKPPSSGDYLYKRYGKDIEALDLESIGDFAGNIFKQTELSGLSVQEKESKAKAERVRDTMMQDPYFKRKYTVNGVEDPTLKAEVQQQVEDAISHKRSETKPYRTSYGSGSGSSKDIFVDRTPDVETVVKDKVSPVTSRYESNIPATFTTPFMFNGEKVALEGVKLYPVAKDKNDYKTFMSKHYDQKEMSAPKNDYGIIDEKFVDSYDGEIEYVPFAKIVKPKDKNMDYFSAEQLFGLSPEKTEVVFRPYDGNLRGAIVGKLSTKGRAYDDAVQTETNRLKKEGKSKPTTSQTTTQFKGLPKGGKF